MKKEITKNNTKLFLSGKIDSSNVAELEEELAKEVQDFSGEQLIIDCTDLIYISSAGLRVLLKLGKKFKDYLSLVNLSSEVYQIFDVTGFTQILNVRKKLRQVSIEGCELIGEGANGKVYRLTKDEIIKVFRPEYTIEEVEAEREASKKAFLMGIPCAISFDTVQCGDSLGTIYETLDAHTISECIQKDHECLEDLAKKAGQLLKKLHEIKVDENSMEPADRVIHKNIDQLKGDFTAEEIEKMHALFKAIPEGNSFIHNDYHTKNIMVSKGELMLIDLGDAGWGNPYFDIIHTFTVFNFIGGANENPKDSDISFIEITYGQSKEFWKIMSTEYFGSREKAREVSEKISPYSELLYRIVALSYPLFPKEGRKAYADIVREKVLKKYDQILGNLQD